MTYLATFLSTVFGSVFGFIANYLGQRAARVALAMTAYLAALAALWVGIKSLIGAIVSAIPQTTIGNYALMGISLGLPDNFEICTAAMLSADALVFLYKWNMNHVLDPRGA